MTAGVVRPWFVDVLLSVLALYDGRRPVEGAAEVLPWFIVACGLAFAGLAVGVGLHTARRARAQEELDRIFTLSPDLITVADFDGRFLRVNPAVEQVLGYTPAEFLARPYVDFVHPDDRERAAAEAAAIARGKRTLTFANRYVAKDGSIRVLEWTSTPVVADRLIYGVARDVTARYRAEADLRLVADEQAALRRVATLVATGSGREAVFRAVAEEVATLLGCDTAAIIRFEPDGTVTMLGGHRARRKTGERFTPDPDYVLEAVRRTGRPARFDTDDATAAGMPEAVRAERLHCGLASPILVGGELWGTMTVGSLHGAFPAGTEDRLTGFTELLATAVSNAEAREELSRLADEQAALRRVATLVAREAPQAEIFRAIAEEIMRLLDTKALRMWRYEGDAHAVVVAGSGALAAFRVGDRFELGGENVPSLVFRTGRPARIDDFGSASGAIATVARRVNFRQAVGTPIVVEGRLWGAMVTATYDDDPLPPETYERLGPFTELMDTAIANAEARAEVERLAGEQAALRRVAMLVAEGAPPATVLDAVAGEMQALLGADQVALNRFEPAEEIRVLAHRGPDVARTPVGSSVSTSGESVTATVRRTGKPARIEGYEDACGPLAELARATGLRSSVSVPIVVQGRLWGLITASWKSQESPPPDTEERMIRFGEVAGTAVANTEARAETERLADEQGALRRVATLVAQGPPPTAVFEAVAAEMAQLLEADQVTLSRYEAGRAITVVAHQGSHASRLPPGTRLSFEADTVTALVQRTGRPGRVEHAQGTTGPIGDVVYELGVRVSVGAPIVVEGQLWGVVSARWQSEEPPPDDTEQRMARFTGLLETAIANAEARAELARRADEQAALRRVATLVAEESPSAELFAKVAEAASVLGSRIDSAILRYEADDTATVMAVFGAQPPGGIRVGARMPVDGSGVTARVYREKRPVRVDAYAAAEGAIADHAGQHGIRSAVGCPILVRGRVWGAMVVAHYEAEPFRPDTEQRVSEFTDLVATAIANAQARAEVRRLADEQAALRRVATLVAEGAAPTRVFDAVTTEVAELLAAAQVALVRFESRDEISILAQRGCDPAVVRAGMRVPLDGDSVTARVRRTGRSARLELGEFRTGAIAEIARRVDVNVTVGAPIVVEGALWGAMAASWTGRGFPPPDAEERQAEFAQLLGTAIANAESRDQLKASRARVLTAGDEARRRVVRDLHDGAQQRLVHTIVMLKLARRALDEEPERAASLLAEALDVAEKGNAEVRELAHGILPAVLTRGGLRAGVDSLVSRLDLPVDVDVTAARLPPEIQASAYFIVAEALTNVIKHAQAARAQVTAAVGNGTLRVQVRDDGIGGADPDGGGLVGLNDRVAALGGRLRIDSPHGGGTVLSAELPLAG